MALMGEQRGYAGSGRYGVRGKKGRGIVVWRNHRILVWNCAGGCDKIRISGNNFKSVKAQKSLCKNIYFFQNDVLGIFQGRILAENAPFLPQNMKNAKNLPKIMPEI